MIFYFIILTILFKDVNCLAPKETYRFLNRMKTACKYNKKQFIDNVEGKKILKNDEIEKTSIENLSSVSSSEIVDLVKDSTSFFIELNLEYFYLMTVLLTEFIKLLISDMTSNKSKEEFSRTLLKVLITIGIHDLIKELILLFKVLYSYFHN